MLVAVVYEESYVLYDERYERSLRNVILQQPGESGDDFYARVRREVDLLESNYSYYEFESFDSPYPD